MPHSKISQSLLRVELGYWCWGFKSQLSPKGTLNRARLVSYFGQIRTLGNILHPNQ